MRSGWTVITGDQLRGVTSFAPLGIFATLLPIAAIAGAAMVGANVREA